MALTQDASTGGVQRGRFCLTIGELHPYILNFEHISPYEELLVTMTDD